MSVRAPVVARCAMATMVGIGTQTHATPVDYTDAVVLMGHPIRVVTATGACTQAAGSTLASAQGALAQFVDRTHVLASVGRAGGVGLDIQYLLSSEVADDPAFVGGLELAAQLWESHINDPIVVVIAVDFTSNQPFLAAASTTLVGSNFDALRGAIISKASDAERAYVSRIPVNLTSPGFAYGDGIPFFPPSAVRRALGIENWTPTQDAQIVFNTDYTFDTTHMDGVTPGQVDLVTVMCHELGHALGFTSSIDANELLRQPLDIFRFATLHSPNNPDTLTDIETFPREWRAGVEAALDTVGAISGVPLETRFSTGAFNGDGRQASHWKDDALLGLSQALGVMDPTYQTSHIPPGIITDADLLALSLIGWDIDIGLEPCTGDIDFDGDVDLGDLQLLLFAFGGTSPEGDLNFDGQVNLMDLQLLLFDFGAMCN